MKKVIAFIEKANSCIMVCFGIQNTYLKENLSCFSKTSILI